MNFVRYNLITVDDRDAPWVTEKIKKLLIEKNYTNYTSKTAEK